MDLKTRNKSGQVDWGGGGRGGLHLWPHDSFRMALVILAAGEIGLAVVNIPCRVARVSRDGRAAPHRTRPPRQRVHGLHLHARFSGFRVQGQEVMRREAVVLRATVVGRPGGAFMASIYGKLSGFTQY